MNTSIAAGAVVPPEDSDIVQAMVLAGQASGAVSGATGVQQLVGVRNGTTGLIYRNALFRSRYQVLRLGQRLARLGYVDELAGKGGRVQGYDAIFSPGAAAVAASTGGTIQARKSQAPQACQAPQASLVSQQA